MTTRRRRIVSVLLIALLAAAGFCLTRGIYIWKTGSMWEGAIQCYYLTWTGISKIVSAVVAHIAIFGGQGW